MTVVNFNELMQQAKTASFDALPIGDYDVVVKEAEAVLASTGSPMIKTKFSVEGGASNGRGVFNNFVISDSSPNALSIFFRNMATFGLDASFFASIPPSGGAEALRPVAAALVGRRVRLTLGQREFPPESGLMRNEVKAVKPAGGPGAGMQQMPGFGQPGPQAPPTGFPPQAPPAGFPQPGFPPQPQAPQPPPQFQQPTAQPGTGFPQPVPQQAPPQQPGFGFPQPGFAQQPAPPVQPEAPQPPPQFAQPAPPQWGQQPPPPLQQDPNGQQAPPQPGPIAQMPQQFADNAQALVEGAQQVWQQPTQAPQAPQMPAQPAPGAAPQQAQFDPSQGQQMPPAAAQPQQPETPQAPQGDQPPPLPF